MVLVVCCGAAVPLIPRMQYATGMPAHQLADASLVYFCDGLATLSGLRAHALAAAVTCAGRAEHAIRIATASIAPHTHTAADVLQAKLALCCGLLEDSQERHRGQVTCLQQLVDVLTIHWASPVVWLSVSHAGGAEHPAAAGAGRLLRL